MKGFKWAFDLNGHKEPFTKDYYVPDATAIEKGEPVDFTQGTGIIVLAEPTDLDDPILGISLEEKVANSGVTKLKVSISPSAVYKWSGLNKIYTLTGGSTTTAVDSSLVPQTDNFFKNGKIKIVSCAADSSLVGSVYSISESTGSTGTLTLSETLPSALASGDTINICLGEFAEDHLGYDLSSDSMNPDFNADGGNVLRFLYSDLDTFEMFFTFEKFAKVS